MPAPSVELEDDLATGRLVLGGCCISDDDPVWRCLDCEAALHRGKVDRVWPQVVEAADWKTEAMPSRKTVLPLDRSFPEQDMELIRAGFLPGRTQDKWFIYWQDDVLYFHRSGTGHCIYVVRFEPRGDMSCMVEADVNRDPDQYDRADDGRDQERISELVDMFLLRSDA